METSVNPNLDEFEQFHQPEYAGFWLRLAAYIIDGLLIGVVYSVIALIFGGMLSISSGFSTSDELSAAQISAIAVPFSIFTLLSLLYFPYMESTDKQATFGKQAVGIIVTDGNGQKLSFLNALGRNLGKIISGMICYIGYFMILFTEKQQGLHDMIANTLVVKKSNRR